VTIKIKTKSKTKMVRIFQT